MPVVLLEWLKKLQVGSRWLTPDWTLAGVVRAENFILPIYLAAWSLRWLRWRRTPGFAR
jgi:hypothetical protein